MIPVKLESAYLYSDSDVDYVSYFNGELIDFDDNYDSQIKKLKAMIDKDIADGKADEIDFAECQVTRVDLFYDEETKQTDYDWDSEEVCYCADSDEDYKQYV